MTHQNDDNESLSPQEIKFNDLIKRGDDLFSISIYRYAKDWYARALELHVNDELAEQKLNELSVKQKFEQKTILTILAAAVVVIEVVWIMNI